MGASRAGRKRKPEYLRPVEDPGERSDKPKLPVRPEAPEEPDWADVFPGPDIAAEEKTLEQASTLAAKRKLERLRTLAAEAEQLRADAAEEWHRVVPELDEWGALSIVDRTLMLDYCVCWARIQQCERDVTRGGIWVAGERGAQKNPSTTAAAQYRSQMRFYISELGLSPSSRGRLQLPGQDDPDDDLFDA